ncbi:MAG: IgGFc-binding protein [Paludibacteraceae bacterium]|nr:IgGFc-binding protein [Paludibacteraceae bacterium]
MKTKTLKLFLLLAVIVAGGWITRSSAQTTEGDDFWVTFLQADQDDNNSLNLQLSISSRENCEVTVENPYTNYSQTESVIAGETKVIDLYNGNVLRNNARNAMNETGKVCYAVNSEIVDTCALHVTSTAPISLFATNYKKATFDATNVLPTASLLDEYYIQTYTPSDHGGSSSTQGSHFAIIAAEDDVVVDYCPTVPTVSIDIEEHKLGDTIATPVLKKGQVFYVWTGKKDGEIGDLSGTWVKARDGKKIAVFQGCPHTNIKNAIKQRDHIFSQAMPTKYWGNTFVLTASKSRPVDIVRIMALHDGTEVRINGETVHTFDFSQDTKHFWEFEIGTNGDYAKSGSCLVNTSCAASTHLFIVSQQYGGHGQTAGDKKTDGDPAMLWINPIEQQIDQVTFATYGSNNGTTYHYTNVVTDKPNDMYLDEASIASDFSLVEGSSKYYYAQLSLGTTSSGSTGGTHTLKCENGNFIAHVYGFTENESYAYSAGGATKELKQTVTINGREFTPESDNQLCGVDTVTFACNPDYIYESIKWVFGDGKDTIGTTADIETIKHYYPADGVYNASVTISMSSSNLCQGELATVTIPIRVTIGRMRIENVRTDTMICADNGKFKIWYENPMGAAIDSGTVSFNAKAQAEGFTNTDNLIITDKYFEIIVPETAKAATDGYALDIVLKSDCGNDTTHVPFQVNYRAVANVAQRGNDILAVYNENYNETSSKFSSFQWYRNGEPIEGETNSYINLDGNYDFENEYYVCMTNEQGQTMCSCPTKFVNQGDNISLNPDTTISIQGTYIDAGGSLYVTTKEEGEYTWYDSTGKKINSGTIPAGGCLIAVPDQKGVCLLNIKAETKRSFKVLVK